MTPAPFRHVAIVGAGLIGSSLARALSVRLPETELTLIDQSRDVRTRARALNLAESITDDFAAAGRADLVVLAVPVGAMGTVMNDMGQHLVPGTVVSDVGSVKEQVAAAVLPQLPSGVHFIGGHPVAGTEESGPEAGFAGLFRDRWCILCPPDGTEDSSLERLKLFWSAIGARVEVMDAAHHDRVLAITSHVPHLIAFNIVGTASDMESVTESEVIKYSAGGFRDFTRIAASDPTMWRDVFLGNKDAVLEMLARFTEDLTALQRAIRWGDGEALHALFTRTRDIRRGIIDAGQDDAAPDFGRSHED